MDKLKARPDRPTLHHRKRRINITSRQILIWSDEQSPLKFQLHLSQTLNSAGYQQSINDECLFHKKQGNNFSYVSTHSDDLLHCVNCNVMAQVFKEILIKTYADIQYHDNASSYIGMSINRSSDLSKIYISQRGLSQRIISDFCPTTP
jgi:hypothetical protein